MISHYFITIYIKITKARSLICTLVIWVFKLHQVTLHRLCFEVMRDSYSALTETGEHPDNENQSDGRTETIDYNIFKTSQSNVRYKERKKPLSL